VQESQFQEYNTASLSYQQWDPANAPHFSEKGTRIQKATSPSKVTLNQKEEPDLEPICLPLLPARLPPGKGTGRCAHACPHTSQPCPQPPPARPCHSPASILFLQLAPVAMAMGCLGSCGLMGCAAESRMGPGGESSCGLLPRKLGRNLAPPPHSNKPPKCCRPGNPNSGHPIQIYHLKQGENRFARRFTPALLTAGQNCVCQ
jgi:hypothetical protein